IELEGQRLNDLSAPKRVRAGIAYVPQEYNVFRNLTVLENLKIAREFMGAGRSQERVLDDEVASLFPELSEHNKTQAGNLRGGQRTARHKVPEQPRPRRRDSALMLQTTFNGIITGVIMTLPALAVTLLFGVLKFPNFAVGAMMTVAAYMAFALNAQLGWPL